MVLLHEVGTTSKLGPVSKPLGKLQPGRKSFTFPIKVLLYIGLQLPVLDIKFAPPLVCKNVS